MKLVLGASQVGSSLPASWENSVAARSLLVILAHPDDESYGLGGTLAKYAADGVAVTLICATRGEAGIDGLTPEEAGLVRERELQVAAAVIGIADVRFMGYRDGKLALADPEAAVDQLVGVMREIRPQVVITFGPDGISGHPDHVAIHQLATLAFDRAALPARLFYLAPSAATEQACGIAPTLETPGGSVAGIDVGAHLVTKVRAMQSHVSQNPPYPGPPEREASHLACHEYFALARPATAGSGLSDLFGSFAEGGDLRAG